MTGWSSLACDSTHLLFPLAVTHVKHPQHTPSLHLLFLVSDAVLVSSSSPGSGSHLRQHLSRTTQQQQLLLGSTLSAAASRHLQQTGTFQCPVGCLDGWCAEDAVRGGLRCLKCEDTLIVDRATGLCGESAWAL